MDGDVLRCAVLRCAEAALLTRAGPVHVRAVLSSVRAQARAQCPYCR